MEVRKNMTQCQLADKLLVSDKTISKWETGKGYPDITLLEPIAEAFSVSITELISGDEIKNTNVSANMMRSLFLCVRGVRQCNSQHGRGSGSLSWSIAKACTGRTDR